MLSSFRCFHLQYLLYVEREQKQKPYSVFLAPTVLIDVKESDSIMKHEILGPILPILTVESLDQAIEFINNRDRPLAVYVYSNNSKVILVLRTSEFVTRYSFIKPIEKICSGF